MTTTPDPELTPIDLANALDAGIDACDAALDGGDPATAAALIDGLAVTADALLDALGAPEVNTPASPPPPTPAARSIADIPTV